jgi:hypothetical protein
MAGLWRRQLSVRVLAFFKSAPRLSCRIMAHATSLATREYSDHAPTRASWFWLAASSDLRSLETGRETRLSGAVSQSLVPSCAPSGEPSQRCRAPKGKAEPGAERRLEATWAMRLA